MQSSRVLWAKWLAVVLLLPAGCAIGQRYPNKPIRFLTAEPGGGTDFVARLIGQGLAGSWGQPVIVENRGSRVYGMLLSKAAPDGYTLLVSGSVLWIMPLLEKAAYDPLKDFAPVTALTRQPSFLLVHPSLPVKTVKELIALAQSQRGKLNYGAPGAGSPGQLAMELFNSLAGVNIVKITYKGSGQALNALISNEVQVMISTAAPVIPHVEAGRLRALAVTSAQPSALVPGYPTVAASGLPGYESLTIYGMFAPAGTPLTIINRLNQEIVRLLDRAETKEKFSKAGQEIVGNSPDEFALMVKSEVSRLTKVIKQAGITLD